jgi:PAS domain S-box-containing protein
MNYTTPSLAPFRIFLLGLAMMIGIFVVEVTTAFDLLGTVGYIMVILYMLQFPQQGRYAMFLGVVSTLLITLGYLFTADKFKNEPAVPLDRALSIFAVWLAVYLTLRYKNLMESEAKEKEQVHAIFDNATEGMLITDSKGIIILINSCAEKMFGYSPGELIGSRIERLVPERLREFQRNHLREFIQEPLPRPVLAGEELAGCRRDGSEFPVAISLSHFKTDQGLFPIAFIIDLTEKKKAEEKLQQEHQLTQTYFELVPVLFVALNKDGQVAMINQYGCNLLGCKKDEVVGKNWFDNFLTAELRDSTFQYFKELFTTDTLEFKHENSVLNSEGTELEISWTNTMVRDLHGVPVAILSAGVNITEKKRQERIIAANHEQIRLINEQLESRVLERTNELKKALEYLEDSNQLLKKEIDERKLVEVDLAKSQQLYLTVAHHFPEGVIGVLNEDMKYVFADGQELTSLGLSENHAAGESLFDGVHPTVSRQAEEKLKRVFEGKPVSFDIVLMEKSYNISSLPLPDPSDMIHEILVVIRNITKDKQMERDLLKTIEREKELNVLKSRFVTMASHELRTPLSTILSSAFLLEHYSGEELEREKSGHVNKIKRSVNNLTELLNDLTSLGKLEEGKIKPTGSDINIKSFLEELVPEMELVRKKNQAIRCEYTGEDRTVCLDKQMLRSILLNLIGNAIKYSSGDSEVKINATVTDTLLILKVIDEGIGIPQSEQRHIFKRFYRAQNAGNIDGSGLGLNIVKKYVKLMKGSIDFQSTLNQGTTFTVSLPVSLMTSTPDVPNET